MRQTTLTPLAWALMGLLSLIWGASFLANRAALTEVGVLTTVAIRVGGAALLMWAWVVFRRLPLPPLSRLVPAGLTMGLLNNALPFTLIVWGQTRIESGLAAILNGSTAIFGVLVAALVFGDERLTRRKAAGVVLGFAGVATAIGLDHLRSFDPRALGQLAVLGATLSYALAAAFGRGAFAGMRPEVAAAAMLTGASVPMLPLALIVEGRPTLAAYGPSVWAALIYLAAAASALAYLLYYRILALAGAGNLLLVTLLVAPVALVLGALAYGEALPWRAYAGLAILALGLLVLDGRVPGLRRAESA